jgi:hypothetical protein
MGWLLAICQDMFSDDGPDLYSVVVIFTVDEKAVPPGSGGGRLAGIIDTGYRTGDSRFRHFSSQTVSS